jgi:hypothetical protein
MYRQLQSGYQSHYNISREAKFPLPGATEGTSVCYDELIQYRIVFEALTGSSPERFQELAARLKPHHVPLQPSPETTGRKPCLSPADQLLLVLIRFHRRPTYKLLAILFRTSEETVKRTLRLMTPLLRQVGWEAPAGSTPGRTQIRSLSLLLEDIPDLAPLLAPGAITWESDSVTSYRAAPITESVATATGNGPQRIVLQRLREAAGLSQGQVAAHFNLRDRRSIGAWEAGTSRPHVKRQEQFRRYLLDKLGMRSQPQLFLRIWQEIMVEEWTWPPLNEPGLHELFLDSTGQVENSDTQIRLTLRAGPGHRAPFLAPPRLPCELAGQSQLLADLKERLRESRQAFLALFGSPGVGKTALAIALTHDKSMLHRFSDGILWARLGRAPHSRASLTTWAGILGMAKPEMDRLATNEAWAEALQSRIGERRMLLVIDDARQVETALLFKVGGPNCAHLVTTRCPRVAVYFAGEGVIPIGRLHFR